MASLTDDPVEVLEHVKRELQWLAAQPAELLDTTCWSSPAPRLTSWISTTGLIRPTRSCISWG